MSMSESASGDPVTAYTESGICVVTLSDSSNGNRLTRNSVTALHDALTRCDRSEVVRLVVLRSDGDPFSLGMDLSAVAAADSPEDTIALYGECLRLLNGEGFVSVAVVCGEASAGAVGLVAACTIVVTTPAARFSLPETLYGLVAANVMPSLRRRLTPARCEYLAVGGVSWSAETAHESGLVDEVIVEDALEKRLRRISRDILRRSPRAISETKRLIARIDRLSPEEARREGARILGERLADPSVMEAIESMSDGQLPKWSLKLDLTAPLAKPGRDRAASRTTQE